LVEYEEALGFVEDVISEALCAGAEEVAVLFSEGPGSQVRFSNNQVDIVKTWIDVSLRIQVIWNRRMQIIFMSTKDLRSIRRQLDKTIKALRSLPEREVYAPLPEGPMDYPIVPDLYDSSLEDPSEKLVDLAHEAIDAALVEGAKRVAGSIRSEAFTECLATTSGIKVCERRSNVYLDIRALRDSETTGHSFSCSRKLSGLNPRRAGEEAGRDAKISEKRVKLGPGRYNTLLWYSAVGNIVGVIGSLASALSVLSKMSPYEGKLNERLAPEFFTLVDDPLKPGGYGSRSFDEEGFPARRNFIIDRGILRTYLHNRLTAMGTETTSNAGWVHPTPWNLILLPGDESEDDLLLDMGKGLVVKNATYLRFQDYVSGDFSAIVRDGLLFVENGEVVGAVRGLRLSDNILRMMSNVMGLGRETRQIYHWWMEYDVPVEAPLIAVKDVGFTSATI